MISIPRFPALLALACALTTGATRAAEEPGGPPAPTGNPLTAEEISASERTDALSIPTPGELLAAVDKLGKPDWASAMRPPISTNYSSRAQMAINIGGLIADGYIAVEAANGAQVKNIGRDIIAIAKPLGVGQDILNRSKSLTEFADQAKWETLKEELEATQNEVKTAMHDNKDTDLVTLVTLGGWLRGTHAMADYVANHYTPDAAKLLRQPGIFRFLNERIAALPAKMQDDSAVKRAREGLDEMEKAISYDNGTVPSKEVVEDLGKRTGKLLDDLAQRRKKAAQ